MTTFGDLEFATLRDVPDGRAPVATHVVPAGNVGWLDRVWARVREEVADGRRAYVVCPRIAPSDTVDEDGDGVGSEGAAATPGVADGGPRAAGDAPAAVEDVVEQLRRRPELDGVRLGVLHGRLPSDEKDRTMAAFAAGDVDVLVSTTVVEVGVDVPAATVMVVLDADRFGLSQLHQLRGRVGRGREPGLCLLVSGAAVESPAGERLAALAATTDGFALARLDLRQRREGDVLGAAQTGRSGSLRLLRVVDDAGVIATARALAGPLVEADPALAAHPALTAAIERMLGEDGVQFLQRG
jgi:ATP-dependent DNA helicase RecG